MIDHIIDRIARAIELALAYAFILAVALNFANVIGRYGFGRSILWADELQIFIMIAFTFLGVVVVTWRRQHLRMDVLANMLPAPLRKLLRVIELVLMLVICSFVLVQSQDYTQRMYGIGRTSDTAGIPMWIPHGSLAIGFFLVVLVCLWQLVGGIRSGFAEVVPTTTAADPSKEGQS